MAELLLAVLILPILLSESLIISKMDPRETGGQSES